MLFSSVSVCFEALPAISLCHAVMETDHLQAKLLKNPSTYSFRDCNWRTFYLLVYSGQMMQEIMNHLCKCYDWW